MIGSRVFIYISIYLIDKTFKSVSQSRGDGRFRFASVLGSAYFSREKDRQVLVFTAVI